MSNDIHDLTAMMFRYCELFDTAQFDTFAALFEHGEWHSVGPGAPAARRWIEDNILLYDGLPRTKHVSTNVIVDVAADGASATGSAYVTIFQALPDLPLQPIFSGRYGDRFVRTEDGWQWSRREVFGDLYGDVSRHVKTSRGPAR
jgi:hypothetical protein